MEYKYTETLAAFIQNLTGMIDRDIEQRLSMIDVDRLREISSELLLIADEIQKDLPPDDKP